MKEESVVHIPYFPKYKDVRLLMEIWKGFVKKTDAREMLKAIVEQVGTPQNPVDWTDPDIWIGQRLTDGNRKLARYIWEKSGKTINPRHLSGSYYFVNYFELLSPDEAGIYQLTEKGTKFLADDPSVVRQIDEAEGLPQLLTILAAHSPAKREDLIGDWGNFLLAHSKWGSKSTIPDTLRRRILNLIDRGFIHRDGNVYTITPNGIAYAATPATTKSQKPHHQVLNAIKAYNDTQANALRELLSEMNPYGFESLVKDLLDAMGYQDVVVTKQSGDKGVDVVADFEFGITQIREVVQVKRHQASITRPVLDQLRGALPYHKAIRGTIITLGKFAQGCKDAAFFPGAAPITLIDGEKLIELMIKHEVAIKKRPQTMLEIDESYFSKTGAGPDLEPPTEGSTL
jgi:restriction system protein